MRLLEVMLALVLGLGCTPREAPPPVDEGAKLPALVPAATTTNTTTSTTVATPYPTGLCLP